MKKISYLFLILTLICIFLLCSCVDDNNSTDSSLNGNDASESSMATGDPATCQHSFGEWVVTKEATCAKTGKSERTCSLCSTTEEQTIAKTTKHTEVIDKAIAATCGKDGLTKGSHCSTCKKALVRQKVIPKTHNHNFKGTSSTCSNCNLKVFALGELTDTVFWCISGDEWEYKNIEITVFGKGDIPNFSVEERPNWFGFLDYAEKINIGSGITSIGNYAFYSRFNPQYNPPCEFNMPDTVKTIKFQAIRMNFKNEELILGKGVQTIEFRAIENAKKIYMPKSIKKLDSDFFRTEPICFYEGTKSDFLKIEIVIFDTEGYMPISEAIKKYTSLTNTFCVFVEAKNTSDDTKYWMD